MGGRIMWRSSSNIIQQKRFCFWISSAGAATATAGRTASTTTTVCPRTGRIKAADGSIFQVVVGLEIHATLQVPTKLFSAAPHQDVQATQTGGTAPPPPNTTVRPFDVALPGSLPVLQLPCLQAAVIAAAALDCAEIADQSRFERKHYVYADLPHGYQITQQRWPLARHGKVALIRPTPPPSSSSHPHMGNKKARQGPDDEPIGVQPTPPPLHVRIRRIQLEQDTAKTTTVGGGGNTKTIVRVDMNRAGAPLIEIVTEPDICSSADAVLIVQAIRQRLQFCRVCDGRMDLGHFRIDGNVNVVPLVQDSGDSRNGQEQHEKQQLPASALTELKNLNSLAQLQAAIDFEARRHVDELLVLKEQQQAVPPRPSIHAVLRPQTRSWVDDHTEFLRYKNDENDYRFLPEPDLPPLVLSTALGMNVDEYLRCHLPELPEAAVDRPYRDYGIAHVKARQIAQDRAAVEYLDAAMTTTDQGVVVANWISNELAGLLNADRERSIRDSPISPIQLAELANMLVHEQVISSKMAKSLIDILYAAPNDFVTVHETAQHYNLVLITEWQQLRAICARVVEAHPAEMDVYRKGGKYKTKITKLFTGKAMEACHGNAHPERLQQMLNETLAGHTHCR